MSGWPPGRASRPHRGRRHIWAGSSARNPSIPGRTISGRAPTRRAMTGVPHASASMAVRPKGSGQAPGMSSAYAPARSRSRSGPGISPRNSTSARSMAGRNTVSAYACSSALGPILAATHSRRPDRRATSMASTTPFSGVIRPTNARSSDRRRSNGAALRSSPLWTTPAQSTSGKTSAWAWLIATRRDRVRRSAVSAYGQSRRPWNVVRTGCAARSAMSSPAKSRWLWTTSKSPIRSSTWRAVVVKNPVGSSWKPAPRIATGTVGTSSHGTSESPLAKTVTRWPRSTSSLVRAATTRSVPP